jgi:hypothetical protein
MLADPTAGEHMKAITALAAADSHLYKVTATTNDAPTRSWGFRGGH